MDNRWKLEFFAFLVMLVGGILLADLYLAQESLAQAPATMEPGKASVPFTQELLDQLGSAKVAMDTVWTLVAAFLVMFMALGFAMFVFGVVAPPPQIHVVQTWFTELQARVPTGR